MPSRYTVAGDPPVVRTSVFSALILRPYGWAYWATSHRMSVALSCVNIKSVEDWSSANSIPRRRPLKVLRIIASIMRLKNRLDGRTHTHYQISFRGQRAGPLFHDQDKNHNVGPTSKVWLVDGQWTGMVQSPNSWSTPSSYFFIWKIIQMHSFWFV